MSRIKPLYEEIKLNIAITSDNHIDTNVKANNKRIKIIKKTLKDIEKSTVPFDAYVTVGDMTSRGIKKNWEVVKECFRGFTPAKNILFAMGNHDAWDESGFEKGYENAVANYLKYCKEICGLEIDKPYFSRNIKGHIFIFLGNSQAAENEDCACLGNEEIEWFKGEMDKADATGRPVFVFCHQSVNNNHGLPKTWDEDEEDWEPEIGGIGKESDEIEKILKQHKNVFYFSGHSHMGLCGEKSRAERGFSSFEEHDGVNYINLPCLTRWNHHGENEKTGIGYLLEVYENKVVIRPRNYTKHKQNKKIIIKDGNPYFEVNI